MFIVSLNWQLKPAGHVLKVSRSQKLCKSILVLSIIYSSGYSSTQQLQSGVIVVWHFYLLFNSYWQTMFICLYFCLLALFSICVSKFWVTGQGSKKLHLHVWVSFLKNLKKKMIFYFTTNFFFMWMTSTHGKRVWVQESLVMKNK